MNPEFQRNLWLEFTPRRVIFLLVALALILLAGHSTFGESGLRRAAEYIFYGLTVIWGARHAATAVIGEMRDRTWDAQRLSSLSPFAMTWGKLLGATAYVWLGGVIALSVLIVTAFREAGPDAAIADLFYFVMLGLMAQSVALFASLLGARRRQVHSRMDVFLYQVIGLGAAWSVWTIWKSIGAGLSGEGGVIDEVEWWGFDIDASVFYLVSLFLFLGWALIGCYRLMRRELSVENSPRVWTAFIVFMAVYVAGHGELDFIRFLEDNEPVPLLYAMLTLAALSYIAVFVEPKDHVLYRWLVEAFSARRYGVLLSRVQAWMISYAATLAVGVALVLLLLFDPDGFPGRDWRGVNAVMATLGFLTRDIAIFLLFSLMPRAKRGDYAAGITLALLYGVVPPLFAPFGAQFLFYPVGNDSGVLGPLAAWGEAAAVWFAVYYVAGRSILDKRVSPPQMAAPA